MAEVAAVRLYTTPWFYLINEPLRRILREHSLAEKGVYTCVCECACVKALWGHG
jgi:hypothetical protein